MRSAVFAVVLVIAPLFVTSSPATLIDRGNDLIYDDVLNITWLKDANLGGVRTWNEAQTWADGLVFGGFAD